MRVCVSACGEMRRCIRLLLLFSSDEYFHSPDHQNIAVSQSVNQLVGGDSNSGGLEYIGFTHKTDTHYDYDYTTNI